MGVHLATAEFLNVNAVALYAWEIPPSMNMTWTKIILELRLNLVHAIQT